MTNHNEEPVWQQEARWLAKIASRLANDGFPTGDHAALRRMDPQALSSHAEIAAERLLVSAGAEPTGEADRKRWLLIIHCLALTRGQHTSDASTGEVLAQVQYSEERINRLLSSDFEVIADVLPRLARLLGAKRVAVDWLPLARIARWTGRDESRADQSRNRVARQYARAAAKIEEDSV